MLSVFGVCRLAGAALFLFVSMSLIVEAASPDSHVDQVASRQIARYGGCTESDRR